MTESNEPQDPQTMPEDEPDLDEHPDSPVRAKWIMDGATTLAEAATQVREFADYLDGIAAEGYELLDKVEDDYANIYKAEHVG